MGAAGTNLGLEDSLKSELQPRVAINHEDQRHLPLANMLTQTERVGNLHDVVAQHRARRR
ncbi:hypothetical protein D0Z66_00255 [Cereibacter sphaeroides]|nr:hypothetical protein D0Z66_00255 [Cereibacter sphaeroides]